ncbi:MAG: hypothetical protein ABIJ00_04795 [Candidatus Eisenbacteria bacterium]
MKSYAVLVVAVFLCGCLYGGAAQAIDLTKYTFPVSTSQEAYLNGTFNVNGTSIDSLETGYNFGGDASYDLFYRSLPFSYNLNAVGNFSKSKAQEMDAESRDAYDVWVHTRANRYFSDQSNIFGFGSSTLEYRKLSFQDEADDPYWDVTAGLGYGRSIDATVLKQAYRMAQDFKRFGVTNKDIPENILIELARVIDRQGEFRSQYGPVEYRKYWYEAMEEVLKNAGVLVEGGLGAIGVLRIQEVLAEPTGRRFYGWEARVGVGVVISDFDGEAGDPLLTADLDWARPVSLALQLNNNAYYSTVFEDDPVHRFGDIFQIYYEVTNRIDWDNTLQVEYLMPTLAGAENMMTLNFTSTYILYIENRLSFNPSFIYSYVDDGMGDAISDWAIRGSLSYRLK